MYTLPYLTLPALSPGSAIFSPPHSLPVAGVSACWCIGGSRCPGLGALVCAGSLPVAACQDLGPLALSGLCLGGDMPKGLRVHGWMYSGVGSWRWGLWARRCSSLGLLHCGCWVVPLGPSSALLWWEVAVISGGSLDVCGSDLQGGRSVDPHTCYCIFLWKNFIYTSTLTPTSVWIQVLTDTQMLCIAPWLPPKTSCIHKYHALFTNIVVI
ncbi:hypothetical protein ILYODFUR_036014 [Ilyodon furcidens]|uniref:Uncharacterized protein n=1 Tax=Ilyodon furcidens TaxID=33524 RepID=A0ABV0VJY1_9TELE